MKTKCWFMTLPLLCAVNGAMAQGSAQDSAPMQDAAVKAQDTVQTRQAVRERKVKRQGEDMRRCLKLKSDAAVIRCAEPGRKP